MEGNTENESEEIKSINKSLSHGVTKEETKSTGEKELSVASGSLKHTVVGSTGSLKKEFSSTKATVVNDQCSERSSKTKFSAGSRIVKSELLVKESHLSKSSTTDKIDGSESVLEKKSIVDTSKLSIAASSEPTLKSQGVKISDVSTVRSNISDETYDKTILTEKSSVKSGMLSSTQSNILRRTSKKQSRVSRAHDTRARDTRARDTRARDTRAHDTHMYNLGREYKDNTFLRKDDPVSTVNDEGCLNRIAPWAKSSTSCHKKLSQCLTSPNEVKDTGDFDIKCIPPWAKTLRKFYGMSSGEPNEDIQQEDLQEKIKTLMEKHSRLMLIKRGESRKQLILQPSETGGMGAIKMASKNTRYYMAPIPRDEYDKNLERKDSAEKISAESNLGSNIMSMAKKTSKTTAKTEVSKVLRSLYNSKEQKEMGKESRHSKNQQICPKITPSNIRDYVNAQTLDPDGQKLHEIIKIKKVPEYGTRVGRKPSSKYIINVPKGSKGEGASVKKITVREKRKIRIDSVEDVNENVTKIVYKNDPKTPEEKPESHYTTDEKVVHDVMPYSKRRKSPTKTRTLEVTAESTPIISDLLKKEETDRDKILLIQYEKRSKPKEMTDTEKPTLISTQLLGIRQPCHETMKEMYLYGTETDGKKCKERITQVDDASPTLREKVNMIFQELREMTFKPCEELESTAGSQTSVTSKSYQYPSMAVEQEAVSVQALPETRSAEVQVHESVLFSPSQLRLEQQTKSISKGKEKGKGKGEGKGEGEGEGEGEESSDLLGPTSGGTSRLSTRVKPTKLSHLGSQDSADMGSKRSSEIKEAQETSDETTISEGDEKGALEKSKQSDEFKMQKESSVKKSKDHQVDGEEFDQSEGKTSEEEEELTSDDYRDKDKLEDGTEADKIGMAPVEEEKDERQDEYGEGSKKERDSEAGLEEEDEHVGDEEIEELEGEKDKEEDEEYKELIKKGSHEEGEEYDVGDKRRTEGGKIPAYMEDIRSYDFDPAEDYELKIVPSSKFVHQKDSLRRLNWSEDLIYLEKSLCPKLTKALAEIAVKQPGDPISYLAHWIYKDYENRESDEQYSLYKEHIAVAKGMLPIKKDENPVPKKFNIVRRYQPKSTPEEESLASEASHISEEQEAQEEEELENENA